MKPQYTWWVFLTMVALPRGVAVASLPLNLFSLESQTPPRGDELQVVEPAVWHFKERRALRYDPSRIAILDATQPNEADLRERIAGNGVDQPTLAPWGIHGWWTLQVAARDGGPDEAVSLARQLAATACVPFVTPIFMNESGGTVAPSPWLLVRFAPNVDEARAHAILAEELAGDSGEPNFAGLANAYRVRTNCADGWQVLALAESLAQRPEVLYAEPDKVVTGTGAFVPNDPGFENCWGLNNTGQVVEEFEVVPDMDIDAPEAWDVTTGDPGVIVLVLDNGVQQDHPDISQVPGFDATGEDGGGGPVNACDIHGTAVAGIISARIDNALGTVGVAPSVSVASARVTISRVPCDGSWVSMDSWQISGLAFGESIGARVTNNSTGFWSESSAVEDKYSATYTAGMVHFAAAGNAGVPMLDYLAGLPGVNGVAALEPDGARASFSNYGTGLDYSAPGVHIYTTDRTGPDGFRPDDYMFLYGTSAASPCAAGVAALVLSVDPTLYASQVEDILNASCVDRGPPGYDLDFGWGFVNAAGAVARAQGATPIIWSLSATNGPVARSRHAMCYDPARQVTVVFGGGDPLKADTWEWNGELWAFRGTEGPSARTGSSMAFDINRKLTVLFGGWDSSGADGETWEWDGATWTQAIVEEGPSARHQHAVAYDVLRGVTVLFGGARNSSGSLRDNETWEWDGSLWTRRFPANRPDPRFLHAMAYDANRGVTVLFGGRTGSGANEQNGETWEWDGTNWTQRLVPGPQPRAAHSMAYVNDRGTAILFGGLARPEGSGHVVFRDTWEWNGADWREIADPGPPPRHLHALAYDAARGRIVVFGGQVAAQADERNDTWEFGEGSPVDFDADGYIDLTDYAAFASCIAGPGVATPPAGCPPAHFSRSDLDFDWDVDASDSGAFQSVFTGR